MKEITLADVETAVKTIAATALKNEQYFCELDSYAGDADFGVSLAIGLPRHRAGVERARPQLDRQLPAQDQHGHLEERRRLLGPDLGHGLHARRRAVEGPHDASRSTISTRC